MRRPLIAGNWKMHGSRASVFALVKIIDDSLAVLKNAEVVLLPPFVFLDQVLNLLTKPSVSLGAQDVSFEPEGAFTGEISAAMLAEFHCRYVLVGHSERRMFCHEDDATVAKKFAQAKAVGIIPILCVGETRAQREEGQTQDVVMRQLQAVLDLGKGASALENAVIAYEPIWAIGTGLTALSEQVEEVHLAIRKHIASYDPVIADTIRIIYGGSLKAANIRQILAMPNIDGGLVGGASLNAKEFVEICKGADQLSAPATTGNG